jgi:hypothetical protein
MLIYRNNSNRARTAEAGASSRPAETNGGGTASGGGSVRTPGGGMPGDILYGARAIAGYLFADDSNRARRRVFNLWTFHRDREEQAGFFKLKGALCLSKSQWLAFHGLG